MRTLASRISLNERVSMERAMSRIKMALIRYEKKIDILIRLNWSSIAILLPLEVVSSKTGVYTCLVQCDKVMIAESSQGNLSFSNIYGENSCSLLVISSSSSSSREDSSSRIELSVALTKSSRAKLVNREAPPVFIFYFLFFCERPKISSSDTFVNRLNRARPCFFFPARPRFCSSPRLHTCTYT